MFTKIKYGWRRVVFRKVGTDTQAGPEQVTVGHGCRKVSGHETRATTRRVSPSAFDLTRLTCGRIAKEQFKLS